MIGTNKQKTQDNLVKFVEQLTTDRKRDRSFSASKGQSDPKRHKSEDQNSSKRRSGWGKIRDKDPNKGKGKEDMLDEWEQSKDNASSVKECGWCKMHNQWYKGHLEETCKKKSGAWTLAKNY